MATKVIMPKQGLQMTEGTIIRWLIPEGGKVIEGEPLFEMETDKLTITMDAEVSGTLLKIVHGEGDVVPITETIAYVGEAGETIGGESPAEEEEVSLGDGPLAKVVIMPKQGLQMTEGTIIRWLVAEGEEVKAGEPLFEMETDKLTITMDAEESGTLLKIVHGEGDVVPITQPIAYIGNPGDSIPGKKEETQKKAAGEIKSAAPAVPETLMKARRSGGERRFVTPRAKWRAKELRIDIDDVPGNGPEGLVIERDVIAFSKEAPKATPLAKRIAENGGIRLSSIQGSGAHGKITRKDVEASASAPAPRGERLIPISDKRRVIASRMKGSLLDMAQANHRMSVDMSKAVKVREQLKAQGNKVSFNDIVMACVARALTEFPMMNSTMVENGIILRDYVNIGMAVAIEGGLIVPVIRDADLMSLTEIAAASTKLVEKVKTNRLQPDEYIGGTFTVSNLGMYGVDSFTAVINPPEVGILAVGKITKTPIVINDGITIRPMMILSLTYDHRVVDGAPAAQFLGRIKELLENADTLL